MIDCIDPEVCGVSRHRNIANCRAAQSIESEVEDTLAEDAVLDHPESVDNSDASGTKINAGKNLLSKVKNKRRR